MARAAVLLALAAAGALCGLRASSDLMKDVTLGFGEALEHCREESQLSEDSIEEFFHFWRDDFRFIDRELGCVLKCMARYFNLLTDSHRMHHGNTREFVQSFPDGEALSEQIVQMIHECEQQHDAEADHCWRILRISECFKGSCQRRGIAPTIQLFMAELIMESTSR